MKDKVEKLKILLKKVGREAKVEYVDDTLEAKQKIVGGLIEVVPFELETLDDALIVCNEEGKLIGLPPNTLFDFDYIAGDYFVIGDDYENGDFKSLTDEQIEKAKPYIESRSFKYKKDAIERFEKENQIRNNLYMHEDEHDPEFYEEWKEKLVKPLEEDYEKHIDEDFKDKDLEE